jgi:transposase
VSATARRNGLSASQLFTWRRLARNGRLSGDEMTFASVVIGGASSPGDPPFLPGQSAVADRGLPPQASTTATSGRIEIVLARGHRVIVDNSVDAAALARVVAVLERP